MRSSHRSFIRYSTEFMTHIAERWPVSRLNFLVTDDDEYATRLDNSIHKFLSSSEWPSTDKSTPATCSWRTRE